MRVSTAAYTEHELDVHVEQTLKQADGNMSLERLRNVVYARFGCDPEFTIVGHILLVGSKTYWHDDGMIRNF